MHKTLEIFQPLCILSYVHTHKIVMNSWKVTDSNEFATIETMIKASTFIYFNNMLKWINQYMINQYMIQSECILLNWLSTLDTDPFTLKADWINLFEKRESLSYRIIFNKEIKQTKVFADNIHCLAVTIIILVISI